MSQIKEYNSLWEESGSLFFSLWRRLCEVSGFSLLSLREGDFSWVDAVVEGFHGV